MSRHARDKQYKLYADGRYFDVVADPLEEQTLGQTLAPEAADRRAKLQAVLDRMRVESDPS